MFKPPVLALAAVTALLTACTTTGSFVAPSAVIDDSSFGLTQTGSPLMYEFQAVMKAGPDATNPNLVMQANYEVFCGKAMLPMMEPGWQQNWETFKASSKTQATFTFTYRCKDYVQVHRGRGDVWNTRPTQGQPDLRISAGL